MLKSYQSCSGAPYSFVMLEALEPPHPSCNTARHPLPFADPSNPMIHTRSTTGSTVCDTDEEQFTCDVISVVTEFMVSHYRKYSLRHR
jgi:hypothetical protein